MDLKEIVNRIINKNNKEYNSSDLVDGVISEDSVRKRVYNLYKEFSNEKGEFNKFPIEKFNKDEVELLLEKLFWKIENGNQREIISNINKINVNVNLTALYFNQDYNVNNDNELNKLKNRKFIRDSQINSKECIQSLLESFRNTNDSRLLISDSFDAWMQLLTYRLYTISIYKIKEKRNISYKILKYQGILIAELDNIIKNKIKLEVNIEEGFDMFLNYLESMIYERNYIEIMNSLISDMDENKEKYKVVEKIYKTDKSQEVFDINVEEILSEGKKVNDFDKKLEETKTMIGIFKQFGGRNCSILKIQDLKIYFREIYLDDTKHSQRARKAMSIVRNYIAELEANNISVKQFESLKDYMFIREKITRGYYRELGLIEEYKLRSKIYENAYVLYSKLYFLYDHKETVKMCNKINRELFRKVVKLFHY
ncbi:hypothetical protein [Clostridium estertheticum]|uniref:hypothetical protein n=1 Tax=Clostridium estertheticum TaxID=238834 RepID=UPI001C6E266D|nr:hypothetical protein [Clostridium estertheticum]MBW9152855.1 hypothetical protein [Clostridium estertheticum]WLC85811.1 hypothetical protein KTC97_08735 [Clostridium estertheticum]